MGIRNLKKEGLILLECISGSKAYGLDLPHSDTDIRGVFNKPVEDYYGFSVYDQVANETNDVVYSELGRFFELLAKGNPTMIELLSTKGDSVLTRHPLFDAIEKEWYLTKQCKNTFAGYAISQIKKAKGLKKKIVNPFDKERKSVFSFCYVPFEQGSIPLEEYLKRKNIDQWNCALVSVPHMNDVYGLYYDPEKYGGILKKASSNEVSVSKVDKLDRPIATMVFNRSGYSTYCKEYKAYWEWVNLRNKDRYESTLTHGKNYDAKNMMHTFRLLNMAEEIARDGEVNVKRHDRDELLKIRSGHFAYADLLSMAEEKVVMIEELFAVSDLPESPDSKRIEEVLVTFRKTIYN